jgi:vacuolar-type H+-ATPase subunit E/Vma4
MSIENILSTIEEEARTDVSSIISKAGVEADKIGKEYANKAKELSVKLKKESEKRAKEQHHRMIVNEQLELRKSLLSKKHEILDIFYEKARKKIEETPREEYIKFIGRLIIDRAISGNEKIIVSKKQSEVFDNDFLKSLNKSFPGGGNFTLSDSDTDFTWGVVLKEEKRVIDLSFDVLFKQVTERVESQVAALLFPEDK